MMRILVAGVGNLFLGDDAFGIEVVRELSGSSLPPGVEVKEFGIRICDLKCALEDGYDAVIIVHSEARGESPGTVRQVQPQIGIAGETPPVSSNTQLIQHERMQKIAGAMELAERLFLVICEPRGFITDDGRLALSEPVKLSVPKAVKLIEELVTSLLQSHHPVSLKRPAPSRKRLPDLSDFVEA